MTDDPNTPPWARKPGSGAPSGGAPSRGGAGADAPAGSPPQGSGGTGGQGPSAPGGPGWLSKPGDAQGGSPTLSDARAPHAGGPPPQGPSWQGSPSGGSGGSGGRGPLIAVAAVIVVLLLAAVGLLTAVLLGGDDEVIVRRPAPTQPAPQPTATAPTTTSGGTTTSSTTTGPREEAPSGGATARALNGSFTVDVPGGWDYQATSATSGGETLRLTAPTELSDFDESYVAVSIQATEAYSDSASEEAQSSRESSERIGNEVSSLPGATLLGQRAETYKELRDSASGDEVEQHTYLVHQDGKSYEVSTYGSPAAHRKVDAEIRRIVESVKLT